MSLVHSPAMTEENLAAHRANGRMSHGPVTPQGRAHSAAANLRHGFYSQSRVDVLTALGEEPEEYRRLMESLLEDLQPRPGLEAQNDGGCQRAPLVAPHQHPDEGAQWGADPKRC